MKYKILLFLLHLYLLGSIPIVIIRSQIQLDSDIASEAKQEESQS